MEIYLYIYCGISLIIFISSTVLDGYLENNYNLLTTVYKSINFIPEFLYIIGILIRNIQRKIELKRSK